MDKIRRLDKNEYACSTMIDVNINLQPHICKSCARNLGFYSLHDKWTDFYAKDGACSGFIGKIQISKEEEENLLHLIQKDYV